MQPPFSVISPPVWHRSAYRGMASSARYPPTVFRRIFLRRTDGLPHFVQRHRVKIRSLRYQFCVFIQSLIQFGEIFLLLCLQLFQVSFYSGRIFAERLCAFILCIRS